MAKSHIAAFELSGYRRRRQKVARTDEPGEGNHCTSRRALRFVAVSTPCAGSSGADDLLETAGQLVGVLKPLYKLEAPLQAGSYDKAAVRAQIQEDIKSSQVVVYSYTLSPFCTEAKQLLEEQGAKVKAIELGPEWLPGLLPAEGAAIRAELGAMTGQTSMPHIFIDGTSIGGLATGTPGLKPLLKSGRLSEMLKGAGAI